MLTKNELNDLRYMAEDITKLEAELDALYTKAGGLSAPRYGDVKGDGAKDLLDFYDEIFAKQREINTLSKEYYRERERIQLLIQGLSQEGQKLIRLRYFENMLWCNIAEELHYSRQHLHRLHSSVLIKLKNA